MSVNHIVRSVGSAIGSALSGSVLATHTQDARRFPDESGYGTAALLVRLRWL